VKAQRVSFFRKDQLLADAAFYRIGAAATQKAYGEGLTFSAGAAMEDVSGLGLDFVRQPSNDAGEQHPSNFERLFFREAYRRVIGLKESGGGAAVAMDASQQVHFITPALAEQLPVGAVRVDLKFNGLEAGDLVSLMVNDPLVGNSALLHIDVKAGEGGRVKALLDFSDQILTGERRMWLTVATAKPTTLDGASTFTVLTVDDATARAEDIAWRLFLLKGYYYVLSEGRPFTMKKWDVKWLSEYDGKEWNVQRVRPQLLEMYRTVEHFRVVSPEHPIAIGQYDRWLNRAHEGQLVESDVPTTSKPAGKPEATKLATEGEATPVGVPQWATLLSKAADTVVAVPNWWVTHRMTPAGEIGGFLSDDMDFYQWWPPSILLDSEGFGAKARETFASVADLLLKDNLRDGINVRVTDPLHAYEEGQNHFAIMPMLFYGDPYYVEQLMVAAASADKWLYETPEGGLRFRVSEFGWKTANEPPAEPAAMVSSNAALLLHSHLMLAWYNHNPHAIDVLKRFCDDQGGWVDGGYGGGPSINFGVYWFTGDPKYLGLTENGMQGRNPWSRFIPLFPAHGKEAWEMPWWKQYQQKVRRQYTLGDWAWATTKDRETLTQSLIYDMYGNPDSGAGGSVKYYYMWTEAEVFTDRVFLPVETTAQVMLGGYSVRNKLWPAYAVSYEKLGGDFAAVVLEQGKDRLKIAMINMKDAPRKGAFRPWQLESGKYEFTIGPDADDDWNIDAGASTSTLSLDRMDPIEVELPAKRVVIYDLKQVEKFGDAYVRPDVAIGKRDVVREGDSLKVTVHNIGSVKAEKVTVSLVSSRSKPPLALFEVGAIEAPLDLVVKTVTVTLKIPAGAEAVVVSCEGREITTLNNRVGLAAE